MKTKILILLFIIGIYNYSHANIVITNGLTHRLKTEKGQTYRGKIEVQNIGKVKKNVKLYLQDVSYDADGTTRSQNQEPIKWQIQIGWNSIPILLN